MQNESFDEDEEIYEELHLDEEEEKFGRMVPEDHESDESDEASEGAWPLYAQQYTILCRWGATLRLHT